MNLGSGSLGNTKTEGTKGSNYNFQLRMLELLGMLVSAPACCPTAATEATLVQVLSAIQSEQEFEAKLVLDNLGVVWLEVRIWNVVTHTFDPPVYYLPGSNAPGVPTLPINYIDPTSYLSLIAANTLATANSVANIDANLSGVAKTPNASEVSVNGSTPVGVRSVSLWFRGNNGTLDGIPVPNGAMISYSADGENDTLNAIAYEVPTTGEARIIITYVS